MVASGQQRETVCSQKTDSVDTDARNDLPGEPDDYSHSNTAIPTISTIHLGDGGKSHVRDDKTVIPLSDDKSHAREGKPTSDGAVAKVMRGMTRP